MMNLYTAFRQSALAGFSGALLCLSVSPSAPAAQGIQSPWGLRNVNVKSWGLNEWSACTDFEPTYAGHGAGYINFWIQWYNIEPSPLACAVGNSGCDPTAFYDWSLLHSGLDKTLSVGAAPAIHFKLAHSELMKFPGSGGPLGNYTRPADMGSETATLPFPTPQFPPPTPTKPWVHSPYSGYSERLYLLAKGMAEEIKVRYEQPASLPTCTPGISSQDVYIIFHPEQWDEWNLGGPDDWPTNLNTYVLSYLTVRQAFAEVQQTTSAVTFNLSHGSIPKSRILAKRWFDLGVGDPSKQSAIVTRFQSMTERIPRGLISLETPGELQVIGKWIDDWPEVLLYADASPSNPCSKARIRNQKSDAWLQAIVDWTYAGYFDFNSQHGHAKARWDDQNRVYFDEEVEAAIAAGGAAISEPQRWIITEAAFEVLDDNVDWPSQANEVQKAAFLAERDQFVLEDFERKWCTMLAQDNVPFGTGSAVLPGDELFAFCSPVVAGNNNLGAQYPNYAGLGDLCGSSFPPNQPPCVGEVLPSASSTKQRIIPTPANQAFATLSNFIGVPDSCRTVFDNWRVQIRFDQSSSANDRIIDVVWKKEFFDYTVDPRLVAIQAPAGYGNAQVLELDSSGNLIGSDAIPAISDVLFISELTQTPRFVVWTP